MKLEDCCNYSNGDCMELSTSDSPFCRSRRCLYKNVMEAYNQNEELRIENKNLKQKIKSKNNKIKKLKKTIKKCTEHNRFVAIPNLNYVEVTRESIYDSKEKTIKVYFSNPDDIRLLDEFVVGRIYYNSEGQGHSYAELDKIRRIEAIEK